MSLQRNIPDVSMPESMTAKINHPFMYLDSIDAGKTIKMDF
jgi:hypothetical protein